MLINLQEDLHVYSEENKVSGKLVSVDFLSGKAVIKKRGVEYTASVDKLIKTELVGILDGEEVHDCDVLRNIYGITLMVAKADNGKIRATMIDEEGNEGHAQETAHSLQEVLFDSEFLGNIDAYLETLEGQEEAVVDFESFNIKMLRSNDGEFKYFYACNNKEEEVVDIISLIVIGANDDVLEYERLTVTYEAFENLIKNNLYVEVSANEVQNYALGMLYSKDTDLEDEEWEDDYLEDEDEECYECGKDFEDCNCDY